MQEKIKKIIFINQVTGYLFTDIVNAFSQDDRVTLLTGSIENNHIGIDRNVKVSKLIKYNRNVAVFRIFTWVVFFVQAFFMLLFRKKDFELFIVSNPPIAPFLGYIFNKLSGTRYHLLIYDVYPDVLVNFKILKAGSLGHTLWTRANKKLLENASTVFTLSNNMAKQLKAYGDIQIHVIPNWAHTDFIQPLNKLENEFAIKHNQVGLITVMYSGNMGATHAVERIADLAEAFKSNHSFSFMAIGDGAKRELIAQLKKQKSLHNLLLLPYQPAAVLPLSLTCADVGIVTLSSGAEDVSVPSKTYNLLAAGVALMVIASPDAELAYLVKHYQCGRQFEEHEIDKMIRFLEFISQHPEELKQMKLNALAASKYFTPENAFEYKHILSNEHVPKFAETID